jgi:hypothetical protein
MKKLSLPTLSLTCALSIFAMNAFASEDVPTIPNDPNTPTTPTTSSGNIGYADFVKSCKSPESYGHQRPAENIRVVCKDVQKSWQQIEAGATSVSASRNISTEVFSDKYHVALENFMIEVPDYSVSCPRLQEVISTSQIEKALTCAQVLEEVRDLKDICLEAITEAVKENPDLVEVVPTGKTFMTCEKVAK